MKPIGKKVLRILISLFFFSFSLMPMSIAEALDSNLSGFQSFTHSAWSANYGYKSFIYKSSYLAYRTTDTTYKRVKNHDWRGYKCQSDNIWPPYVGNGTVYLWDIYMVDTSGKLYSRLLGSSFTTGQYYSRLVCSPTYTFGQKICATEQKASKNLSLKNRINTWFELDSSWTPHFWMEDYTFTQSY